MAVQTLVPFKWARIAGSAGTAANVGGNEVSMWLYDGSPGAGVVPTTWANPDNTTAGSLMQSDPSAGNQLWLTSLIPHGGNTGGPLTLYDRLGHMGGLNGTLLTAQNVNGGADATITRTYTDPAGNPHIGNEIWLEVYTTIGPTQVTATVNYKNENGVSHVGTCQFGGSLTGYARLAQTMQKVTLASGDRGVSSVTSVTLSASTTTAGNFGVSILHPFVTLTLGQYSPEVFSGALEGDIEILPGACLMWSAEAAGNLTTTLPGLFAQVNLVER